MDRLHETEVARMKNTSTKASTMIFIGYMQIKCLRKYTMVILKVNAYTLGISCLFPEFAAAHTITEYSWADNTEILWADNTEILSVKITKCKTCMHHDKSSWSDG